MGSSKRKPLEYLEHPKISRMANSQGRILSLSERRADYLQERETVFSGSVKPPRSPRVALFHPSPFSHLFIFTLALIILLVNPFIFTRRVLGVSIICFNGDMEEPELDCPGEMKFGMLFYTFVTKAPHFMVLLIVGQITLQHGSKSMHVYQICIGILSAIALIITFYDNGKSLDITMPIAAAMSIVSGYILQRKKFNVAGGKILFFTFALDIVTFQSSKLAGPYLSQEFLPGIRWSIFVPIYVQLSQGLSVYLSETLYDNLRLTKHNQDSFLFLAKWQMLNVNTLKFAMLMKVVTEDDALPTIILSLLTDALGRIQILRYSFRALKAKCTNKKAVMKLKPLTEVLLCSEFDTDLIPWILATLMKVLGTPFENTIMGIEHTQDDYLTLRSDSFFNQSASTLLTLLALQILGHILTLLLSKVFSFCKMYNFSLFLPHSYSACIFHAGMLVQIFLFLGLSLGKFF